MALYTIEELPHITIPNLIAELFYIVHPPLKWFGITLTFVLALIPPGAPLYFQEFIKFNSDIHDYPTRFNSNIHIQRTNKRNSMISLFFKGFDQYNKLPVDIKCSKSLAFFKKKALEHAKNMI
ncbi:hypothetical protein NQ317_008331 [Molorchus minor]|uniref:Uncharacterized protein n=1 Tax=Molorchus minor TaxID=1323400 RepID=A0ABQ9JRM6_9CUCU|nr:hypothetical protein NQ317_008331 [Molorchus minor]